MTAIAAPPGMRGRVRVGEWVRVRVRGWERENDREYKILMKKKPRGTDMSEKIRQGERRLWAEREAVAFALKRIVVASGKGAEGVKEE